MQVFDYGRELLKWIAIITMTVDHVGAVLYPELDVLRWIGRLSFPLFAYLLMLGLENTRNVRNYFVRLFTFALISQVPFFLATGKQPFEMLNIFFTLSLGLAFVYYFRKGSPIAFIPLLVSLVVSMVALNAIFMVEISSQILSLAALPLIVLHQSGYLAITKINPDKRFRIPLWRKYFFYAYYPLHLALLYAIKVVFF